MAESIDRWRGDNTICKGQSSGFIKTNAGKLQVYTIRRPGWNATLGLDLSENNPSIVLEENQEKVSKLPAGLAYGLIHRVCSPAGLAAHAVLWPRGGHVPQHTKAGRAIKPGQVAVSEWIWYL